MTTYMTSQGDVWDLVAYKIWGNEMFMDTLIKANPEHIDTVQFDGGIILNVPDRPADAPASNAELPPWRAR